MKKNLLLQLLLLGMMATQAFAQGVIDVHAHLLYGSDYPYAAPKALTAGLDRMRGYLREESDLAPHRENILRGNALRMFSPESTK